MTECIIIVMINFTNVARVSCEVLQGEWRYFVGIFSFARVVLSVKILTLRGQMLQNIYDETFKMIAVIIKHLNSNFLLTLQDSSYLQSALCLCSCSFLLLF